MRPTGSPAASVVLHQVGFLGWTEPAGLRQGASQPDLSSRGVSQLNGYKPTGYFPVPGLNDKMADRPGDWVQERPGPRSGLRSGRASWDGASNFAAGLLGRPYASSNPSSRDR